MRKFTLGLNAAKNTGYIEKYFQQKFRRIKFLQKTQQTHMSISTKNGAKGLQRCVLFKVIPHWNGNVGSLQG